MSLPELTHLQFLILEVVADAQVSGRNLREKLAELGVTKTGPAFYQLMARMEDAGYVKGWYEEKMVDGQRIKERFYEIKGTGLRAVEATRAFYDAQAIRRRSGGLAHG
jgi:DNA-binding PadR family transcriptional regulator